MISKWTQHIKDDPVRVENFERDMYNFRHVLERLKAIVDEMERDLGRAETDPRNYNVPNWDYRQAHNNGYRQALGIIQKLVDLDEQETISNDRRLIKSKNPEPLRSSELLRGTSWGGKEIQGSGTPSEEQVGI